MKVYGISYDSPKQLEAFADSRGIDFHLLADEHSTVIKRFGILNTLIEPDDTTTSIATGKTYYGLPFPGVYVTDKNGVVTEKLFNRHYGSRDAAGSILHSALGKTLAHEESPQAQTADERVKITAFMTDPTLALESKSTLIVRLELSDGLHIYGEPLPDGYVATTVKPAATKGLRFGEPEYPQTRSQEFSQLNVTLSVYVGVVEIAIPISATAEVLNWNLNPKPKSVETQIAVGYQACSDKVCFPPKTVKLNLEIPLAMHDVR